MERMRRPWMPSWLAWPRQPQGRDAGRLLTLTVSTWLTAAFSFAGPSTGSNTMAST
jgi:hypothetical protein